MNTAQQNYEKINTYSELFPSVLDEYKRSYINYNKNPDYNEYSQIYSKNKGSLNTLNSNVFVLTNDIQKNIDNLNKQIVVLDSKITEEKNINSDLKKTWGSVKGTSTYGGEMVGGCAGTEYGCCPDMVTVRNDLSGQNCINGLSSARQMNDDATDLYKTQFTTNVFLLIGSIGLLISLFTIFKKPQVIVGSK
jgi:preprotein translocase subunit Sss1